MNHSIDLQRILSECSLLVTCLLLVKLYVSKLSRVYRFFGAYLLFEATCSLVLMLVRQGNTLYGSIWIWSKPLYWVLCLMVLLEVYSLVLARYPGIASLMRWTVVTAAVAAAAIAILTLTLDFQNPNEPFPLLRCAFAVQRTVDTTMVISVLVPLLFMLQFPVRLSRNAVVHCLLFAAMAAIEAGALFVRNHYGREWTPVANLGMVLGTIVCRLAWIALLNRRGEQVEQPVGPMCSPQMEQQLLRQLRMFNDVLMKAGQTQFS
jgi:hypothetical protein